MQAIFEPTSRHHALLTVLDVKARKELYNLVRDAKSKQHAIQILMIECGCRKEAAAELAYEVGMHMINEENINQNLLN